MALVQVTTPTIRFASTTFVTSCGFILIEEFLRKLRDMKDSSKNFQRLRCITNNPQKTQGSSGWGFLVRTDGINPMVLQEILRHSRRKKLSVVSFQSINPCNSRQGNFDLLIRFYCKQVQVKES